jgi:hypothetical protein
MSNTPRYRVKPESWVLNRGTKTEKVVAKVAVRDEHGRFHPATNFRGSVIG